MPSWPQGDLEAVSACPVCASPRRSPLHAGLTDRVFGFAPGEWTLMRCEDCGSGYLDPRPTEASIGRAYAGAGGYYTHVAPAGEPAPSGTAGRLRRALRNGYSNRRLGLELAPTSPVGAVVVPLVPPLRAGIGRFFRHLPLPRPGARLLDVGCGNGEFVLRAGEAGWAAAGIEIDPAAAATARAAGLDIRDESIAAAALREPGAWDALTLSHVIEHVHDPGAFLRAARTLLRPGGALWIATPNLLAAGHARYGADWMHLDPPRHQVLFTPDSLARAVRDAGFADLTFPTPWSLGGDVHARSQVIRDGGRPTMTEHGSALPDLLSLARPRRAEEIVLVASAR